MGRNSLIVGINCLTAAIGVAITIYSIAPLFAPITPSTGSLGAAAPTNYQVQHSKPNDIPPSTQGGTDTSTASQSPSTPVMGQQGGLHRTNPAGPDGPDRVAINPNNAADQSKPVPPAERSKPSEASPTTAIAPTSQSPPPSEGTENLPAYMRYF